MDINSPEKVAVGFINKISEIKRCYANLKIKAICPICQSEIEKDFSEDYLSYPKIKKPFEIPIYCNTCDDWFHIPGYIQTVDLILYYYPSQIKKE